MSRRHLVLLLVLGAVWGSAFMLVEIALRDLAPETLLLARVGSATIVLALVVAVRGELSAALARLRRFAGRLALAALVNTALPFFLIAWGQQYIDSGVAGILVASAPLFTVLLAFAAVRSERVTGLRLAGFMVGFGGVVVLVGGEPSGGSRAVLGALAVVASAALYSAGALYAARRLSQLSPLLISLGMLGWSTVFALPAGLAGSRGAEIGWESTAAVLALGVFATSIAFILYFRLLVEAGASRAILVTYLVPSLAVVYGVTLLDEPLTLPAVAGLALVLAGVALGTGAVRPPGRLAAAEG